MKQILSTDMKPTKWISLLAKHVLNQIVLETKSKLIILGMTHNRKRKGDRRSKETSSVETQHLPLSFSDLHELQINSENNQND